MKIKCVTHFDITATGVRSTLNKNRIPFRDAAGQHIRDEQTWNRSRNQQRNWETLTQIISLRALPTDITNPDPSQDSQPITWSFEFEVERPDSVALGGDPLGSLSEDCRGVPMIIGLDESPGQQSVLQPGSNIHFTVISH